MKKVLALLLAVVMVIGMTTMAMADVATDGINIPVKFKLVGEGTSPAENFTIQLVSKTETTHAGVEDDDVPNVTITPAEFAAGAATTDGASGNINVKANGTYTVPGHYKYTFKQVAVNDAGVVIDEANVIVNVLVTSDTAGNLTVADMTAQVGDKKVSNEGGLENTYSAGKLEVSKTVTGNLGDRSKYFRVTVTLTGEDGKDYSKAIVTVADGSKDSNPTTIAIGTPTVFEIKDGDTIKFNNIPYGVTYSVAEDNYTTEENGKYEAAKYTVNGGTATTTAVSGEAVNSATETVGIENHKQGTVDTGIVLDSLPYILIGVAVAAAAVLMVAKKRRIED